MVKKNLEASYKENTKRLALIDKKTREKRAVQLKIVTFKC